MGYVPSSMASMPEWQRIVASELNNAPWANTNTVEKTADYTAAQGDDLILMDAAAANLTVTLPPANQFDRKTFKVKKIDASANTVTIDGDGSTIDGAATDVLSAQWESRTVTAFNGSWYLV